jgi:hypothetical protein
MARLNKTILTDSERFRWLERVADEHGSVQIFGGLAGHYEVDILANDHEGDILASGSGVTIEAAIDICAEALEEKLG